MSQPFDQAVEIRLAVVWANGACAWYRYGKKHRENGEPASILADGTAEYWLNGVKFSRKIVIAMGQLTGVL